MLEIVPYTLEELLRERREGAVRAIIRAVGYALARGCSAEDVGRYWFESYRHSGEFRRMLSACSEGNGSAFVTQHMVDRWGWCDSVQVCQEGGAVTVASDSMLVRHDDVLSFHGVSRMDMEACVETLWRLSGHEVGLEVTYTIGDDRDWMMVRGRDGASLPLDQLEAPSFTRESLAAHRRLAVAAGIVFSIGFAKAQGAEPEDLGLFFYKVWEGSGHYDKLRDRWGFGNALAYAQSIAQSRQILYVNTTMVEDLDGYTITSPSWGTEIPNVMGTYGVLPDDVYRYFAGGGVGACARLGLQYADQSDDRVHRVWLRAR